MVRNSDTIISIVLICTIIAFCNASSASSVAVVSTPLMLSSTTQLIVEDVTINNSDLSNNDEYSAVSDDQNQNSDPNDMSTTFSLVTPNLNTDLGNIHVEYDIDNDHTRINYSSLVSLSEFPTTSLQSHTTNVSANRMTDALEHVNPDGANCQEGLLLPVWLPQDHLTVGDRAARGTVYFLVLIYLFIGVSIVSDRFMASIEVITSKEKEVSVKKPNGEVQIIVVRVWNETVANLTLMALGSSAPEILLSVIEIVAKNFNAGELGPGTIVGSAAYNLFVIMAVCIWVIPDNEVRKIKHLRVFFVTATWSVFAYIWLYLILAFISPGQVDIWEGFLTFLFFPMTVGTAYIADKRLLIYKYTSKEYRMSKRGTIVQSEAKSETNEMTTISPSSAEEERIRALCENGEIPLNDEGRVFEDTLQEYMSTLKDLRKRYPQSTLENLEIMAQEQVINKGPKSRAFYRIQATRRIVGSGNIMRKISERAQCDLSDVRAEFQRVDVDEDWDESIARVFFEPSQYTVMESCETFEVRVVRRGDMACEVTVDFATEDGTAEADSDYVGKRGTLRFPPGVDEQRFTIEVIDDEVFEQDEHFYVRLSNVSDPSVLVQPKQATVVILDDDHGGIFAFATRDHELVESVGKYEVKVQRYSGARGRVKLAYWTEDGTAKGGKDYIAASGDLEFDNNESE